MVLISDSHNSCNRTLAALHSGDACRRLAARWADAARASTAALAVACGGAKGAPAGASITGASRWRLPMGCAHGQRQRRDHPRRDVARLFSFSRINYWFPQSG